MYLMWGVPWALGTILQQYQHPLQSPIAVLYERQEIQIDMGYSNTSRALELYSTIVMHAAYNHIYWRELGWCAQHRDAMSLQLVAQPPLNAVSFFCPDEATYSAL